MLYHTRFGRDLLFLLERNKNSKHTVQQFACDFLWQLGVANNARISIKLGYKSFKMANCQLLLSLTKILSAIKMSSKRLMWRN